MCRLAPPPPTPTSVRDWFVEPTQALGCHTTIDAMANIFGAIRPPQRRPTHICRLAPRHPAHRQKIRWNTQRYSRSRDAEGARRKLGRDRIPSRRCQLDKRRRRPLPHLHALLRHLGQRHPAFHRTQPPRSAPRHRDPLLQALAHRLPR